MRKLLTILFVLFLSNGANAAPVVTCTTGAGPFVFPFPSTVTVSSAPPVGTLLTGWINIGSPLTYSCNSSAIYWSAKATGTSAGQQYVAGGLTYTVFATNVPGIGIVLQASSSTANTALTNTIQHIDGNNGNTQLGTSVSAAFIVTGPIVSTNSVPSQVVAQTYIDIGNGNYQLPINYSIPAVTVTVTKPTCTVATPSIQVPLGNVGQRTFTGVGSTSAAQAFNIVLNCSGGASDGSTTVYTTLTDQTNAANRTSTLNLTTASTATGVGIQILNGTNLISYGPASNVIGNTNQWKAGITQAGPNNSTFTIPLSARYVQTLTTVTAGTANGVATFTMGYQ